MCPDPRNDRPAGDGLTPAPPVCQFCGNRTEDDTRQTCAGCSIRCLCEGERVPLTNVPVDGMGPGCDECAGEIRREAVIEESWNRSERGGATMGTVEALGWAVEMALGGDNLLNGAEEECDICDEPRGHEPTGLINREDAVRIGGGAPEVNDGPSANGLVSGGLSRTYWRGGNASNVSHDPEEDEEDETMEIDVESMSELVHGRKVVG